MYKHISLCSCFVTTSIIKSPYNSVMKLQCKQNEVGKKHMNVSITAVIINYCLQSNEDWTKQ